MLLYTVNLTLDPAYPEGFARRPQSHAPLASPSRSLPSALPFFSRPSFIPSGAERSRVTRYFWITPFFSAFPYIFVLSPLSTAFTLFDRGGRVGPPMTRARIIDLQLTPFQAITSSSRTSFLFTFI